MIIRIDEKIYYQNKSRFIYVYKKAKLKWIPDNDGWFSKDGSIYLLKLDAPVGVKRFESIDCKVIEDFLISIGGVDETKINIFINEVLIKPYYKNIMEYKEFIGADLYSHYRTKELLRDKPLNWGVIWK